MNRIEQHKASLREAYIILAYITDSAPINAGKYTVPVFWDKKTGTIVNNESSEILRFLNSEFNDLAKNPDLDLYPEALRKDIDEVNTWVYRQA